MKISFFHDIWKENNNYPIYIIPIHYKYNMYYKTGESKPILITEWQYRRFQFNFSDGLYNPVQTLSDKSVI